MPEPVRSNFAGGGFGSMAFTSMRPGNQMLSTLSRPTGHLGSGRTAGSPAGVAQAHSVPGWGHVPDSGKAAGPLQQSRSVPTTPTMLMDTAGGPATGGQFAEAAGVRESPHSASAPVLPTAPPVSSPGLQTQEGSRLGGYSSPAAPTVADPQEAEPAAGHHGAGCAAEPSDHSGELSDDAHAEQQHLPSGGTAAKQHLTAGDAEGSSGGAAAQQARAPGLRKNKFSSFSSDVPPDRHWPPGAPSSGVSGSTTPVDASPALVLRQDQQAWPS